MADASPTTERLQLAVHGKVTRITDRSASDSIDSARLTLDSQRARARFRPTSKCARVTQALIATLQPHGTAVSPPFWRWS